MRGAHAVATAAAAAGRGRAGPGPGPAGPQPAAAQAVLGQAAPEGSEALPNPVLPPAAPASPTGQGAAAPSAAPRGAPPPAPAGGLGALGGQRGIDRSAPVTFTADEVEYDQERGIVTARGRVEAWQGERILRADEFTYNRNTGVATASGNVQLLEPDGQVLFADRVELSNEFRDGVLEGLRGLLAAGGRVAATGARRTGGTFFDLARVVYSACEPCASDPLAPPIWQLRSRIATLDQQAHQVRYRDASLVLAGVPVFYTPYFAHPDGTTPRQSGFLTPYVGVTRFLGPFVELPYYWAIDESQDLTVTPVIATRQVPNLGLEYRRRFNFGEIEARGSLGYLARGDAHDERGFGYHIFSRGRFSIDENWRAGFDFNRASSELYLRTYRFGVRRYLPSLAFTEGFWGTEGYARMDLRAYQGLRPTDETGVIPNVLPNTYAEWSPGRDALGGYLTLDTWNFVITRDQGTSTRRLAARAYYELPRTDSFGSVWTFRSQIDTIAWSWDDLNLAPNFAVGGGSGTEARANLRVALDWRLPLVRSAGAWGSQLIEPRVQFVTGPNVGSYAMLPNEDSIDFEFTDANLFALNRFYGRDRQEGGTRVDAALRGAWYFPNGGLVEGLVGKSFRFIQDSNFPADSGLQDRASDWVGRVRVSPVPWLEVIGRTRLDKDTGRFNMADVTGVLNLGPVSLSAGYLYSVPTPGLQPPSTREEVSAGVNARLGEYWRVGAFARYDININRPVLYAASVAYEDECFLLEGRFVRNYAEDPSTQGLYPSNTIVLLRIGLKTVADFGFRAI
ncbi:MAG: LPS-assembly protein LptD [Acetobacteraceae bacterium]|nr:LPS-assembly protein LptD [Acetobacteraceae bacterium]